MANDGTLLTSLLRTKLNESSAAEWSDAELLIYLVGDGGAEFWLADLIGKCPNSGLFRVRDTFTLSASTETYAISSLTSAATKAFAEPIEVQMQVPGGAYRALSPFRDGEDGEFRGSSSTVTGGTVLPRYTIRDGTLNFLPLSTASRAMAMVYRWVPVAKTSAATALDTPASENPGLLERAAHFALSKAGETNVAFDVQHAALVSEIENRWTGRIFGARTETVRRTRSSRALFT